MEEIQRLQELAGNTKPHWKTCGKCGKAFHSGYIHKCPHCGSALTENSEMLGFNSSPQDNIYSIFTLGDDKQWTHYNSVPEENLSREMRSLRDAGITARAFPSKEDYSIIMYKLSKQMKESSLDEKAPPGMEDLVMKLKKEYPGHEEKAFATAWSIYNRKHGKAEESIMEEDDISQEAENWKLRFDELIDSFVEPADAMDTVEREMIQSGVDPDKAKEIKYELLSDYVGTDEPSDNMTDVEADADTLASAGYGSDEDYGYYGDGNFEIEEDFDLNNGYDDVNHARGNDYFPTGADSPVVKDTGPSGARQGDNPEQKKMQVSEVHKELVYNYRNFLTENKK